MRALSLISLLFLTSASVAKAEEWNAALSPNHELSAPVAWGNSYEEASEAALKACKLKSDSCARPAATIDKADIFALMCCEVPKHGCSASAASSVDAAHTHVKEIFEREKYSKCGAPKFLKAIDGTEIADTKTDPPVAAKTAASSSDEPVQRAFDQAKELGTASAWDAFLSAYPTGFLADLAKAYKQKLDDGGRASPSSQTVRATITSPLTSGFILPDRRGRAPEEAVEQISKAIATIEKVRDDDGKRKLVCDMTDMVMDGDLVTMLKEREKRAKKRDAMMRQVGPGFSTAWRLEYKLSEEEKATGDFDKYINVHNKLLLSCPNQWLGTKIRRSFAGFYQTPARTIQIKYDSKYWDENNEYDEPPFEPLQPGREDFTFRLTHNAEDGTDLAEIKFRSTTSSGDEVRKQHAGGRVSVANGIEVIETDFQDSDTKGLDFHFPDLGLEASGRSPSKEFEAARSHFVAAASGLFAGSSSVTDATYQEAAGQISLTAPSSRSEIKSDNKFCSKSITSLRGVLAEDYDAKEQMGYQVDVSEPCAVEYVIVPSASGCAKGSLFAASGVVVDGMNDDADDVMNLKAAKIVCATEAIR